MKGKKAEVGEQGLQPVTDAKSQMTAEKNEMGGRRKSSVQVGKALHVSGVSRRASVCLMGQLRVRAEP